MPKYKQRSDGRYHTFVSTGKPDDNGKPIRISVYGTSSRDLENKVATIKADLERGSYANDKGTTLKSYAQTWFAATKENSVDTATARDYKTIINKHYFRFYMSYLIHIFS